MSDSGSSNRAGFPRGAWWRLSWLALPLAGIAAISIFVVAAGGNEFVTTTTTTTTTIPNTTTPVTLDDGRSTTTTTTSIAPPTTSTTVGDQAAIVERPNIVFILVDDLRPDEMELGFGRILDNWTSALETELIDKGSTLENFYITTPLCCPSRASILSGLYAHNHLVFGNSYASTGGFGGYPKFFEGGYEDASLGLWMDEAGYHTAMVGKYMNGFPNAGEPAKDLPTLYIPPGWDEWYATKFVNRADYYKFSVNENGTQVPYGTDEAPSYLTDVHTSYAVDFIERAAAREEPFFLYLSPNALHLPIRVAPRHKDFHRELLIPVPGSYGEEDLSDKPRHVVTGATPRTEKRWDKVTEQVLDMTLPIDEMIAQVVAALDEAGVMDETYIFFVSGNGLLRGEHGLGGKGGPYEESILAPMVVRGPGIREGHTMTGFGLNIDIVPTLLHFAGAPEVGGLDGESLFPVLLGNGGNGDRSAVLLELRTSFLGDARFEDAVNNSQYPTYFAVRTPDYLYVEHHTQEAELYDMNTDPFQLDNIPLSRADPDLVDMLQSYLRGLATCAGTDCALAARGADVGAPAFDFVCRNFGCTFTALGSIDEGNHAWDFADGTGAQGYQVEHRYLAAGDFEVTLAIAGQVVEARTVTVPLLAS